MAVNHEFARYRRYTIGGDVREGPITAYSAVCSCGWNGVKIAMRGVAWNEWNAHRYTEAAEVQAGLKQALTGQEP